jgi:hypothetical protein
MTSNETWDFLFSGKIVKRECVFEHSQFGQIYKLTINKGDKYFEMLFELRCDDEHPGRAFLTAPKITDNYK